MALLRADILTSIQYIILIILINMINQQALIKLKITAKIDLLLFIITSYS